jgi:hypothetical protein
LKSSKEFIEGDPTSTYCLRNASLEATVPPQMHEARFFDGRDETWKLIRCSVPAIAPLRRAREVKRD